MWLDQQFYADSVPYHIGSYIAFDGPLDAALLARATRQTASVTDALQLVFDFDGRVPRQRVLSGFQAEVPVIDLTDDPDPHGAAMAAMQADVGVPFAADLPPVRFVVYRLSPTRHYWYAVFHHLIGDGWGWYQVMAHVIADYNNLADGKGPTPAPPAFLDQIARDQAYLQSPRYQRDRAYWQEKIARLPEAIDLPDSSDLRCARLRCEWPREQWRRLEQLAETCGVSPLQTMVALYGLYLARAHRAEALTLRLPVLNRGSALAKRTPGHFAAEKPLVLDLAASGDFLTLVKTVAADLRRDYRHQAFPLGRLPEKAGVGGRLGRFVLSFQKHRYEASPHGTRHRVHQLPPAQQRDAITLHLRDFDGNGPLVLDFDYQAALFPPGFIEDLAAGLAHLCAYFSAAPSAGLHAPSLLPMKALVNREHQWNAMVPPARPIHFVAQFRRMARLQPDRLAVWQVEAQYDYATLDRDSDRIAQRLIGAHGIGREISVAALSLRGYDQVCAMLGILKAGGVLVPLDADHPAARQARMIELAKCRLLLVDDLCDASELTMLPRCRIADLRQPLATKRPLPPEGDPAHSVYLLFTSGSTGEPKCCRLSYENLGNWLSWKLRLYRAAPDRFNDILHSSMTFDARLGSILLSLCGGGTLTAPPADLDHITALRWVCENENPADLLDVTPTHLETLIGLGVRNPRFRRILCSGEVLTPDLVAAAAVHFPNARLYNQYGPTEATIGCTAAPFRVGETIHLGNTSDGTTLYIVDAWLRPLPRGVAGELAIGGIGVGQGYDGRPARTASVFVPDPFEDDPIGKRLYRSGDLVRRAPDGTYEFLGRIDNQIKINGQRIEPEEIEDVLRRFCGVQAAAVLPHQRGRDKVLVAFYAGAEVVVDDLRAHAREFLTPAMVPSFYVALDALPMTTSGKTNRVQLAANLATLDLDGSREREGAPLAPGNEFEAAVLTLCAEVLEIPSVDLRDSFLELGGNSLGAVRLASLARTRIGRDLRIRDILLADDLAALARCLAEAEPLAPVAAPAATSSVDQAVSFPLSAGQRALWFHQKLNPTSCAYHMPGALDLHGTLNRDALTTALNVLQQRHEALRVRFEENEDGCRQRVTEEVLAPAWIDVSLAPDPAAAAERHACEAAAAPFVLTESAPLRLLLLRLAPDHHRLVLVFHHIIADGQSLALFFRELSPLYRAATAGADADLAPAPRWREQAPHQAGFNQRLQASLPFWRRRLAHLSRPEPAYDYARPTRADFHGDQVRCYLAPATVHALTEQAGRAHGGLFTALTALTRVLLYQMTGHGDLTVGTPYIGRDQPGAADAFGYFVTTLVVRAAVTARTSFSEVLATEVDAVGEALENPPPPLEDLAEALEVFPEAGRTPFFDVMVVHEQDPCRDLLLPELTCSLVEIPLPAAKMDLTLVAGGSVDGGLTVTFHYRTALFAPDRMARLAADFAALAETVACDGEITLGRLPRLTWGAPTAKTEVLSYLDGGPSVIGDQTLVDLFEATVLRHGDAVALIDGDQQLTYNALDGRANAVARLLAAQYGVGLERRVGLLLPRGMDQIIAALAVMKAGGAYVPLDPEYPRERLQFMAADAELHALVTVASLQELARDLSDCPIMVWSGEACAAQAPSGPRPPQAAAFLIYTSGSTGRPKAAVQPHRGFANIVYERATDLALAPGDVWPMLLSFSFDAAQLTSFTPLVRGAALLCVAAADREDPERLIALMNRHRATHLVVPPAYMALLGDFHVPSMKRVISGGEAPDPKRVARYAARFGFTNDYGPSECSVLACFHHVGADENLDEGVPLGRPPAGVRILLLDDGLRQVTPGTVGQLVIGGVTPGRGYHRQPGQTAAKWVPDPFSNTPGDRLYLTGDYALLDGEGRLRFHGRRDDQVKIRGNRVTLGEITRRLSEEPGVAEALVTARVAGDSHELIAYLCGDPGVVDQARAGLRLQLPEYMVPAHFVVLDRFPLNANGKIDRNALPEPEALPAAVLEAPVGDLEQQVARTWCAVLGIEAVGRNSDFFALGGQSLSAMRVAALLRRRLGRQVAMRDLFERPILAEFAARLCDRDQAPALGEIRALPVADHYPVSHAQRRLWVLDQMAGAAVAYNMPGLFLLEGGLEPERLARAFKALFTRHQALRTVFKRVDGEPYQHFLPLDAFELSRHDARGEADPEAHARVLAERDAVTPFDLSTGPLMRASLYHIDPERFLLSVCLHHIICDGWSLRVMTRELFEFYRDEAEPTPLPFHYKDFAVWQNETLAAGDGAASRRYWRQQFATLPAPLDWVTDRPRGSQPRFRGGRCVIPIDAALGNELLSLARARHTGPLAVLQALVKLLLFRTTDQTDLVVGVPVAGRDHAGLDDQVGFYVNMLALRDTIDADADFDALLLQVGENTVAALAHQTYPFDRLVEELPIPRESARAPLFDVVVAYEESADIALRLPGLRVAQMETETPAGKFDATFAFESDGTQLLGILEYNADLFDAWRMTAMAQLFVTLARAVVGGDRRPLHSLPVLTPEARAAMVTRAAAVPIEPADLLVRCARLAAADPQRVAVVDADAGHSISAVWTQSGRLANALRAAGIGCEQRVAVLLDRRVALPVAWLAVLRVGAAFVPLDPAGAVEPLRHQWRSAGCSLLIHDAANADKARQIAGSASCDVAVGDDFPAQVAQDDGNPDQAAYLLFTSGTTGRPKAVVVPRRALNNIAANYQNRFFERIQRGQPARLASFSPTMFDPSVVMMTAPIAYGHELHLTDERALTDVHAAAAFLRTRRIHFIEGAPGFLTALGEHGGFNAELAQIVSGGDVLSPALAALCINGPELFNAYGPTETCVDALGCRLSADDLAAGVAAPIGRVYNGLDAYLLDKRGLPVPEGAAGELAIGGLGLARGYDGQAAATAAAFVPHPFRAGARLYRSGDRARRGADGRFLFLGRRDAQIKLHGYRIELAQVEEALQRLPGIVAGAAKVWRDARGGRLAAYLVPRTEVGDAAPASAAQVATWRQALVDLLPRYMVPSLFVTLPALPLGATGKVDRAALPEPAQASGEVVAPRDALEQGLAAVWGAVLGVGQVGVHDDFYQLGGHSLSAIRLAARVASELGLTLELGEILRAPTVAEQADLLRQRQKVAQVALTKVADAASYPVSHAQRRMWVLDRLDPVAYNMPGAVWLEGALDVTALEQAFSAVVARHESLRTLFVEHDGAPRQRVLPAQPQRLHHVTCDAPTEAAVQRFLEETGRFHFDLAEGPLVRLTLLQTAPQQHLLVVNLHHIVADEWSIGVLTRELGEAYRAFRHKTRPNLPELTWQYRDFAAFEAARMETPASAADRAYWRAYLAGNLPVLELPADRPRPSRQSFAGGCHVVTLDAALASRLTRFATDRGQTPFALLTSLALLLLQRHSGADELVVGLPMTGRDRVEQDNQIGLFLNTLVLRARVEAGDSFAALFARIAADLKQNLNHRGYPFDCLIDDLDAARDLSRSPVFQAMVVLQDEQADHLVLDGLQTRPQAMPFDVAKCDVTFFFRLGTEGLTLSLEYAEFLGAARMRRFTEQFATLAQAAVAQPDQPAARLALLTPAQQQAVLALTDRRAENLAERDVLQQFAAQVVQQPEAEAVVFGDTRLRYRELDIYAAGLASRLVAAGVARGAVIAVALPRGAWVPVALLGVLRAGAVYLPLDPAQPPERLRALATHAGAAVVIAETRPAWLPIGSDWLAPTGEADAAAASLPCVPQQTAYLIYTSGSTGTPKGVVCTHGCLAQLVTWQLATLPRPQRVAAYAPLGFDVSVQEMLVALCGGATLFPLSETLRTDVLALAGFLRTQRIDQLTMPYSALALLVGDAEVGRLPDLRLLATSGEAVQRTADVAAFLARHPNLLLHNQYGPSETHVVVAGAVAGDDPVAAPIGTPIDGNAVYLLDAHLQPVPQGVVGELYLAGANLANGYLADPAQTADRFVPDPFGAPGARMYRSGDLGRLLSDGRLAFHGRNDFQLKIRGFRVEPDAVAALLRDCDGVREAVVVGVTFGQSTELAAYLVTNDLTDLNAPRRRLAEQVPAYMVPSHWTRLDQLPRLASGKIDIRALPQPEALHVAEPEIVDDALTQRLIDLWSGVLGRSIRSDDDFFAAGGHSLKAMQLVAALRKALQLQVALVDVFEAPTPAAFATRLHQLRPSRYAPLEAVPTRDRYPLSPAQRRLWLLVHMDPANTAYHVPVALRLTGPLDEAALSAALSDLVARHQILRTRFVADGEVPHQVIDAVTAPVIERRHVDEDDALALAAQMADAPFDLTRDYPLRIALLTVNPEHHLLLLCFHHIAADGWSLTPLMRDLERCYRARCSGQPADLAPLALQYCDFAVFQEQRAAQGLFEKQSAYWRERLGVEPAAILPTDLVRPEHFSYRGACLAFELDAATRIGVLTLAETAGVTPFVVLLGAFQLVLARWCGGVVPRIGTPVANRERAEEADLIGFFVNTLVIAHQPRDVESARAYLQRLRQTVLAAFDNGDLPFETLVEQLQPDRNLGRNPLFDITFAYHGAQDSSGRWDNLQWSALDLAHDTAKFDLTLSLVDRDGRLCANLEYCRDLFVPATIERLSAAFRTLLAAMVAGPDQAVTTLPILSADQQRAARRAAGIPRSAPLDVAGIHQRFARRAAAWPQRIALSLDGEHLTYGDLEQRANRLAHYLVVAGVRPETLVALQIEPSFETMVAVLAVLKAGGAYLPLDPRQPRARLQTICDDARPALLLHAGVKTETLPEGAWRCIDLTDNQPWRDHNDSAPSVALSPDNAAYVIYTSGSTGKPKGVVVAHRQVLQLFNGCDGLFQFNEQDVWTLFHSYSFDFSVWEMWGALTYGGRLVIVPYWAGRTPARFLELLQRERVTVLSQTPSAFAQLLAATTETSFADDSEPCYVVFGGEALDVSLVAEWRRRRSESNVSFINMYGITETCVHVTFCAVDETTGQGDVGSALPHLSTLVADTHGGLLPFGVTGEILVAGAGLARGYLNQPALTAERFRPHPAPTEPGARVYCSGDLGQLMEDGRVLHRGRRDNQVQIRGFRIELGEVRAALAAHPQVYDAAVITRESDDGPVLVAYLVPVAGVTALSPEPRHWAGEKLPLYMLPAHFVLLETLPLTVNGKLDVAQLPDPQAEADVPFAAPQGEMEHTVARLWQSVLAVPPVGRHDNFFALGGHSLAAARVIHRLQALLGVELNLREFFAAPTVAELAAVADAAARAEIGADTMLGVTLPVFSPQQTRFPASHAQRRMWFLTQIEGQAVAYNMPHALALHGDVDQRAMVAAFDALIQRHQGLRAVLQFENGELFQQILPAACVRLVCPQAPAGLERAAWRDWARQWCEADAHQTFDLARQAPLRAALLRYGDEQAVLYFNLHHAAGDGWTIGVILRELAAFYRFYHGQSAADLPDALVEEPLQITRFAAWQADLLAGTRLQRERDFWLERLQDLPPRLELPLDRPRPAVRTYRGQRRHHVFDRELSARLETFAQQRHCGLFFLLTAVVKTLLYRYSGQTDFVLGTPVAARPHPRLEGLVGCLVNTLPLRDPFDAAMSFEALLAQTRTSMLAMLDRSLYPFEQLVDDLALERDTSRPVLFDVLLVMQNADLDVPDLGDVAVDDFTFDFRTAKFDLLMNFWQAEQQLHFNLEYNADLFDADRIERLFGHVETLFRAVLDAPQTSLNRLPLLPASEHRQLLHLSQRPAPAQAAPTLVHALARRVAEHPQREALVYGETRWTYAELDRWSAALATAMRAQGVNAGDVVAVCLPREQPVALCLVAVLRLGATYAYLDPKDPPQRRTQFLADIQPTLVVAEASEAKNFADLAVLVPDAQPPVAAVAFDDVVAPAAQAAYLIYTSGSTGRPKAVVGTYRCLQNLIAWQIETMGTGLRCLGFAALGFDVAVQEMLFALLSGGTLYGLSTVERLDMQGIAATISRNRIDLAIMPYTPLSLFCRENPSLPACLRHLVTSGERLRLDARLRDQLRAHPTLQLHNQYGPSETHVVSAGTVCGGDADLPDFPSIGVPISDTACWVLDVDGRPAPLGVPGELFLGGANVARGYQKRPRLTAASFVPAPAGLAAEAGARLYRTGDRCFWDAAGKLQFIGRRDDQLKIRGFRVEPGEVTAVLAAHQAVAEAAVVAYQRDGRAQLAAYYVAGDTVSVADLQAWLRARLPEHMVPEAFVAMDALPMNANGKLDRRALPQARPVARAGSGGGAVPSTGIERQVAEIWQAVLGLEQVGLHDAFFEVGGNSFSLIEVHGRLKQRFGDPLPVVKLFEHTTIAALAGYLANRETAAPRRVSERGRARREARTRRKR